MTPPVRRTRTMRENYRLRPVASGAWRGVPMNAVRMATIQANIGRRQ